MKRYLTPALLASIVTSGAALTAHARISAQAPSSVEFTAVGPAGLKIVGNSTELSAADTNDSVVVTVPLAKLDTGIELRNKHMLKYLDADRSPNAELVVAKSAIGYPNVGTGEATGQLTLHGKTKPVKFKYEAKKNGDGYAAAGSFRINIKDFGIEVPSYLGVTVKPEVDVAVKLTALDR